MRQVGHLQEWTIMFRGIAELQRLYNYFLSVIYLLDLVSFNFLVPIITTQPKTQILLFIMLITKGCSTCEGRYVIKIE